MIIEIDRYDNKELSDYSCIEFEIEKPRSITFGPWRLLQKIHNYPIAVYQDNKFKELIFRTVYPRQSYGAWALYAFKYKQKWYTSLCDDIYGYLTVSL